MTPEELRQRNFITVKQTAEILGVDERTVRRGIDDGQVPAMKVGTKTLIIAPRLAALIDPAYSPPAPLPAVVETTSPGAIAAAAEILRGALRALEALAGPDNGETGPRPGDRPAHTIALHAQAENEFPR